MIHSNLNFILPTHTQLPTPSFSELQADFYIITSLTAIPLATYDYTQDLWRVLTFRPSVNGKLRPSKSIHRGYFAYGKEKDSQIHFDIYAPPLCSLKKSFPPKALETCIALFMKTLANDGYIIPEQKLEYVKYNQ